MGNGDSIGWWVGLMESQQCAPFIDVGASEVPRAGAVIPESGCFPQVAFLEVPLQAVPNHTFMPLRSSRRLKCVGNIIFLL